MATPESSVPSLRSLVDRLGNAAYELDDELKTGAADSTELTRASKIGLGYYDTSEGEIPLYNSKSILFTAARSLDSERHQKPLRPHLFTVRFDIITQHEVIPPAIDRLIDPELIYDLPFGTLGDVHTQQSITYTVDADNDDIDVTRDIGYTLWSYDNDTLYDVSETDDSAQFEHVPLPHEHTTLHVVRRQSHERIDDLATRIPYEIIYSDMTDGIVNANFYNELVAAREAEATLSILALIHSLKTGKSIPNILENIPEI